MIKKTILMLLVFVGGVMTANAENLVTIYFQPNSDWATANASFKLLGYTSTDYSSASYIELMEEYIEYGNKIYKKTIDISTYPYIKFSRYNSDGTTYWNATTVDAYQPSGSTYYYMTGSDYGDWSFYPCTASAYLPCNYYMVSNTGTGGAWKAETNSMDENSGVFSYSFSGSDYAGKLISWIPGYALSSDGSISDFNKLIRPTDSTSSSDGHHWINFQNYTYNTLYDNLTSSNAKVWYIPSSAISTEQITNDGTITISFNKSAFSASISCSKTVTINAAEINGAYYATFSSNYNVAIPDGVIAYYASTAGNGSVTMTPFENGIASAQGAFLKLPKASDNYTFTPASSTDNITTNYLAKGTSDGVSSSTSGYNYVFARQQGVVGFYKVGTTATGSLEGKAYLHSETSLTTTTAPYLSIELDGETTDIKVIDVDFMQPASNNGATYDLSGRRVENMTKGVYIVNGKKVIVK